MVLRKWMMQNGLWVRHQEMPTPLIALTLHIKGGSSLENKNEIGIAHFLEHMVYKASEKYPSEELISGLIEREGAFTNAFTSYDRICFYIHTLANLELMFDILSDGLLRPLFRDEDIAVERGAVLQEIAEGVDDPDRMLSKLYGKMIWGEHSFGGDILGTAEQVSALNRDDFRNYYQRCFTPQNIVLCTSGGASAEEVFRLAFKYFCNNTKVTGNRMKLPDVDYSYAPPARLSLLDKELEQIKCCLGILPQEWISHKSIHKAKRIAAGLLSNILGGGLSSRLFGTIRSKRGLVYYIRSGISVYENSGSFWIDFGTSPSNLLPAISLIFKELDHLLKNGITADELAKVKNAQKTHYAKEQENSLSTAFAAGRGELNDSEMHTTEEFFKLYIDPIGVSDVMDVAQQMLLKENFYLAAVGRLGDKEKELENILNS